LGDRTVIHVSGILRGVDNLRKMFPRLIERRDSIRVHSDVDNTLSIVVEHLISSGSRIREIRVEEPTLEDVFLELTGKKLN
jgi:ABC-2 type transport system ATP-binding protein